jgi:hypothetical protein
MKQVVQLNITIPNSPSSLAKVCDKLRANEVNIEAITVTEGNPMTTIHLVVNDPETAKIVLREIGTVTETDAISLVVKNKPGAIAAVGRAFAAAGINIGKLYSTTTAKESAVVVTIEGNVQEALSLLKTWMKNSGMVP